MISLILLFTQPKLIITINKIRILNLNDKIFIKFVKDYFLPFSRAASFNLTFLFLMGLDKEDVDLTCPH